MRVHTPTEAVSSLCVTMPTHASARMGLQLFQSQSQSTGAALGGGGWRARVWDGSGRRGNRQSVIDSFTQQLHSKVAICITIMNFALRMMHSVFKIMNFVFKMMSLIQTPSQIRSWG